MTASNSFKAESTTDTGPNYTSNAIVVLMIDLLITLISLVAMTARASPSTDSPSSRVMVSSATAWRISWQILVAVANLCSGVMWPRRVCNIRSHEVSGKAMNEKAMSWLPSASYEYINLAVNAKSWTARMALQCGSRMSRILHYSWPAHKGLIQKKRLMAGEKKE
eukprot:scaffold18570_cov46-Prasinocladus_malaysianus.AAC.3